MEYLAGSNLFTTHFVIGAIECGEHLKKTRIEEINALHEWLSFKDSDWGMNKYKTSRTQYVSFLNEIDLNTLVEVLTDLIKIYRNSFPYSTKPDFIEHTLGYSLYELEKFISMNLTFYGDSPVSNYGFYYHYDQACNEFLDFAIPSDKTVEYFKQYYRKVIELINKINFDKIIVIKESLEQPKANNSPKKTPIQLKVEKAFSFMEGRDPRTNKPILNQTDYNNLIEWLTYYFENDFRVPEISNPIKNVSTNKTFVQGAFKRFFKILYPSMNYPDSLFILYQACFEQFRDDRKSNFLKSTVTLELEKLMNIRK